MTSYKMRNSLRSDGLPAYTITVPATIADVIPVGTTFVPELTEDGILYRPVAAPPPVNAPSWTKTNGGAA